MLIDRLASLFVFSVPYILAVGGYFWLARKVLRMNNRSWKVVAGFLWIFGCGYTVVTFARTVHEVFEPMNFDLVLIAINCFLMLLVAVAIALGKPE